MLWYPARSYSAQVLTVMGVSKDDRDARRDVVLEYSLGYTAYEVVIEFGWLIIWGEIDGCA